MLGDGDDQSTFWGSKFSIPGFFGWLDLSIDFYVVLKTILRFVVVPWLRSSANEVQTNVFCCCIIDNDGVALHCMWHL